MDAQELSKQLLATVQALRAAQDTLDEAIQASVSADRLYRVRKAQAQVQARSDAPKATVADLEAAVDLTPTVEGPLVADLRYERDLKEGLRASALERVRGIRQQVSALQSIAGLMRSEAELAKYEPVGVGA